MLIHILTLMMMFMINLMTFNSLDGMEEAVLREASVLPLLQNWPGGHLGNNDAADFYNTNCFPFNISTNTYFSDFCMTNRHAFSALLKSQYSTVVNDVFANFS